MVGEQKKGMKVEEQKLRDKRSRIFFERRKILQVPIILEYMTNGRKRMKKGREKIKEGHKVEHLFLKEGKLL